MTFEVGPPITLAVRRGMRWKCSACDFDMTDMDLREAATHFYISHGTPSDVECARKGFPGMAMTGRIRSPSPDELEGRDWGTVV